MKTQRILVMPTVETYKTVLRDNDYLRYLLDIMLYPNKVNELSIGKNDWMKDIIQDFHRSIRNSGHYDDLFLILRTMYIDEGKQLVNTTFKDSVVIFEFE